MSNIARIELGRFDYDFIGEFKFFKPDPDGKIRRPSVLVRITDEDGLQGWGQAVPTPSWTYETPETVITTIKHYLAEPLLDQDPQDLVNIHEIMNHEIKPACSIGQPLAKAAIDLACYDLVGKQHDQAVTDILGGSKTDKLQLSWTINSVDMSGVESQLEEGHRKGYTNFNFKVGPPQNETFDLELAKKIRNFSPDGFLWADANTGYDEDTVLGIMPKLADIGVAVMESPLPPHKIRGYQALVRQGAVPIFMDEGIILDDVVEEFIELGMLDGITIKTARAAGILQNKKIIEVTQKHGKALLGSGLTDPDISLAASLHLFAWAGIDKPCALNGPQYLGNTLVAEGIEQDEDWVKVPKSPGLGLKMKDHVEQYLTMAAEL